MTMERIFRMIKEKQLFCFFLLTYLISWTVWFISPVLSEDVEIQTLINYIGFYGPGVAAIIIAGATGLNTQPAPTLRYWLTFTLSFLIVFIINLLSMDVLGIVRNSDSIMLMAAIGLLAALVLSGPVSKNRGIRRLLRYVKKAKVHWKWYVVALLGVPILTLISLFVDLLLGGQFEPGFYSRPFYLYLYNRIILFLAIFIYGSGSLGQEPGWRGFALHRLLTKFNPLIASVIVGAIWTLWHAPLFFNGFYGGGAVALLIRFLWNIPLAIPFTWMYMKTKGSLLHVALLNTTFNTLGVFVPMTVRSTLIFTGLSALSIIVIVIENRMWLKRDTLAPFKSKSYWSD